MRGELVAIASLVLAGSAVAETTALVATDAYVAADDRETTVADVAWSAHIEWRTRRRELVIDLVQRESLLGDPPRRELHELAYVERIGRWSLTGGRFRIPGGYWLIADGGALAVRRGALEAGVHAGQRSFTNGRVETVLTDSPHLLPLVGASITRRGELLVRMVYTYTRDLVLLPGDAPAPRTQPEQFLDAELLAQLGARAYVSAGATAGTRYLVTSPATLEQISDDPRLETMWLGSQAAYGVLDVAVRCWRLSLGLAALRTKVRHASAETAAITGSFVESSARAAWRPRGAWRALIRYRARAWADARHAQRVHASTTWRPHPWLFELAGGVDVHANASAASGYVDGTRLVYRATVGYKTARSELAIGGAATSTIGDELAATPSDTDDERRAPYTLGARSYAFVRAFATRGSWFAGLEVEVDATGAGVRSFAQLGWAR